MKEVWKVPKPLRRIVHTLGWPLRKRARYGEFGGSWIYPMGDEHVSLGFVLGLEYADVELSAHDVLQEFKTHGLVRKILEGGERVAWGAKTITEGGLQSMPSRLNGPGFVLVGESAGLVNVPRLKGVHYAIESGRLAAEATFAALQRGEVAGRRGALDTYDEAIRSSYMWTELTEVRNMRQVFDKGFFMGGALASAMTVSKGKLPPKNFETHPNADAPLLRTDRASRYPAPDGKLTFDKLSSVFASGNRTRDDQPNHVRIQTQVPRDLAEMWQWMCPAQVYEVGEADGDGTVRGQADAVELRPVRRDQRQGRPADPARGRLRPRVHADLSVRDEQRVRLEVGHRNPHLALTVARYDVAVVGAGILGLAVARELQSRRPGLRLVVLDKEHGIGAPPDRPLLRRRPPRRLLRARLAQGTPLRRGCRAPPRVLRRARDPGSPLRQGRRRDERRGAAAARRAPSALARERRPARRADRPRAAPRARAARRRAAGAPFAGDGRRRLQRSSPRHTPGTCERPGGEVLLGREVVGLSRRSALTHVETTGR